MKDEDEKNKGSDSFVFNEGFGGDFIHGDKETVHGDKFDNVEGDVNTGQLVEGDVHGDANQVKRGDYLIEIEKDLNAFVSSFSGIFGPAPTAPEDSTEDLAPDQVIDTSPIQNEVSQEQGSGLPRDEEESALEPISEYTPIESEHHPENVAAMTMQYAVNDQPSEEDELVVKSTWTAMLSKISQLSASTLRVAGPVLVAAIRSSSSPLFPFTTIAAAIDATVAALGEPPVSQ